MKILVINESDIGGGAERVASQLMNKYNSKNVSADMLVAYKKSDNSNVFEIKRSTYSKFISRVINKGFNLQSAFCGSYKYINEFVNKGNYNIVHYHNIHGDYMNLTNLKYISSHIPAIWTLHDMWSYSGRCAVNYNCNGYISGCGECRDSLSSYPRMYLDNSQYVYNYKRKIICNSNITFVSPSNWMKKRVEQSFLKDKRVEVINNGVDIDTFRFLNKIEIRKKYNLDINKQYVLFLSADINNKYKGFKFLVDAFNNLDDKNNISLLVVGKNLNNNLFSNIEVINFGYITQEEQLNEIYSMADVFVNPTLADNFPCTILESMASGTPVISTDVGGISEIINEETGWLIKPENLCELSSVVQRVLNSKVELKIKSKESRLLVEKNFSIENTVKKYLKLYNTVASDFYKKLI